MSTITIIQGNQNDGNNHYLADNLDTWGDITSWDTWTFWNSNPDDLILRIDDDLGDYNLWLPELRIGARGLLNVQLKISATGSFTGEETTITVGATPVAVVSGRYYRWTITVEPNGTVPEIGLVETNYSKEFITQEIANVDTSTLSGTIAGRIVPTSIGTVYNVQVTAQQETSWVDRAYALPDSFTDPTDIAPIPGIISHNPLTIVLRDDFGVLVDGVVDISITGSPQIYLTANGVVKV